jgi:Mg2+ and Co2+ transporter CorA
LNFTVARRSEEEAEAARQLNIMAAIFLPLSTLTGVFGMTMQSRTGFENQDGSFWIITGCGLGVGLLAAILLGRRK